MFTPAPWRGERVGPGLARNFLTTDYTDDTDTDTGFEGARVFIRGIRDIRGGSGLGGGSGGAAGGNDGGAVAQEDRRAAEGGFCDRDEAGGERRRRLDAAAVAVG